MIEIKKTMLCDGEKPVGRDELILHTNGFYGLHQGLFYECSLKGDEMLLDEIPQDTEHIMIKLNPNNVFNHFEEEYNKVKEFNFSKIEIKDLRKNDLRKHIKNL